MYKRLYTFLNNNFIYKLSLDSDNILHLMP